MRYLILILLCFSSFFVSAQTAEDSVKATVNELFLAMQKADSAMLIATFAPQAVLQTIHTSKTGEKSIRTDAVKDFASSISKAKAGELDEKITFASIKIDGDLASVWTPYSFYYKGNFSHCGVNSFQLVRLNNAWKIQYLIDTRRKTNCL